MKWLVACAVPVARNSAAIPVRRAFFTRRRPSTLLPECKGVLLVAELETFGTQGSDFRCALACTCTPRCASGWRDTDISHNLIRTRKCAHWDNKANPPHLPMLPSAAR